MSVELREEIPSPREVLEQRDAESRKFAETVKNEIVASLTKNYNGEPIEIWVDGHKGRHERAMWVLKDWFRSSGWLIEIIGDVSSQKDGDSTRYRLTARNDYV